MPMKAKCEKANGKRIYATSLEAIHAALQSSRKWPGTGFRTYKCGSHYHVTKVVRNGG